MAGRSRLERFSGNSLGLMPDKTASTKILGGGRDWGAMDRSQTRSVGWTRRMVRLACAASGNTPCPRAVVAVVGAAVCGHAGALAFRSRGHHCQELTRRSAPLYCAPFRNGPGLPEGRGGHGARGYFLRVLLTVLRNAA